MSSAGQPTIRLSSAPTWEYHVLAIDVGLGFSGPKLDIPLLGEALNRLGREGWELVNTEDLNRREGGSHELVLIFKRPQI
jgi:hypothetical protein